MESPIELHSIQLCVIKCIVLYCKKRSLISIIDLSSCPVEFPNLSRLQREAKGVYGVM